MSETTSVSSVESAPVDFKDFKVDGREVSYMAKLMAVIIEKRGVTESTAKQVIGILRRLNGGNGFTSLAFLTDVSTVRGIIEKDYAPGTQKTMYGRVISALSTMESGRYKKPLEMYRKLFEGKAEEVATETKERGTDLTKKEADAWMSWPDILAHYEKVGRQVKAYLRSPPLTSVHYDRVLDHLLLTLYTQMPPRRTKDYGAMWVTRKEPGTDLTKNYYVIKEGKMYFNVYKTAKTHGQQVVDVPEHVQKLIMRFLKLTGGYRASRGRAPLLPLICNYDGAHYSNPTKVTLFLNRAFDGRKISCNILRHAYISSLYTPAVGSMADTADAMAHSVTTHLTYFRAPAGGAGTADSSSDGGSVIEHV